MARSVAPWIGKTDDEAIPARVKLRVFDRDGGRCQACTRTVGGAAGPFEFDHRTALVNGGAHAESNLQLLCSGCHRTKSAEDVAEKSAVYETRKRHLGLKKPRPLSRWKRKVDGTVVLR